MKTQEIAKYLINVRDKWIAEMWNNEKKDISMEDMGKIWNLSVTHIWRILKQRSKINKQNKML